MFFSIIIPVFNCEKYLCDCLDSCVKQDLPNNEYEILCINDGSTDTSIHILNDYANKYRQIKVFSQENRGVSAARNIGLDNAKGEYIMFVDGDDLIRANCLRNLKETLEEKPCARLRMGAYMGDSAGADIFKENLEDSTLSKLTLFEVLWMSLLRRSIIEEYRLRFVEGITHHEDELFLTDFQNACSEVVEYPLNIYYYRRSSGTAIDRTNPVTHNKMMNSFIKILGVCKERMNDSAYSKKLNYELWQKNVARLFFNIPEEAYPHRLELLVKLRKSKPYLKISKSNKNTIEKSLRRNIRRSSGFRHFEIVIYSNALGARMIVARRKFYDTKISYVLRHPRRFLKNPIGFMRTARIKTNIINHRK